MGWKPQVQADDTGNWYSNALIFATEEEAEGWVQDRANRWLLVRAVRVIEVDDPVTHRWIDGRLADYEPPDLPGWEGGFAANH
jgi:hypothetical protein